MTIGERIRDWRSANGWTIPDLADRLDITVSVQSLGRYERNERIPGSDVLEALVRLGCDPAVLLGLGASQPQIEASSPQRIEDPPGGMRPTDPELFARILDAIAQLYKSEGLAISLADLGRLAAPRYDEIVISTDDPAERIAMIKLMLVQLRAEIRAAEAEPGKGKSSA